ncbi:MAG: hypothetical protein ABIN69_02930 [Aestuariivirga sp.]
MLVDENDCLWQTIDDPLKFGFAQDGCLARLFGRLDGFLQFEFHFSQFEAVENDVGQTIEKQFLLFFESAGNSVSNGQCAKHISLGIPECNSRIKADVVGAGYHGTIGKTPVQGCIANHHAATAFHGMVTEADGPWNLLQFNAKLGLEPVTAFFSEAEKCDWNFELFRRQLYDIVKRGLRRGSRYPVTLKPPKSFQLRKTRLIMFFHWHITPQNLATTYRVWIAQGCKNAAPEAIPHGIMLVGKTSTHR